MQKTVLYTHVNGNTHIENSKIINISDITHHHIHIG